MEMKIEKLPTTQIAFIRVTGAYGSGNASAMEGIKSWATENHLLDDEAIILGIPRDNPESTPPDSCRYDACVVVSNEVILSKGDVNMDIVDGGK